MQISFAVTAKLISTFVFTTWIVQPLYFLNAKIQASSHLVWLYSLVSVGPGQKYGKPVFSQRGPYNTILAVSNIAAVHSLNADAMCSLVSLVNMYMA